jgi:hypothetical protein
MKEKSEGWDIGAKGKWETIQWTFIISGKIFSFLGTILVKRFSNSYATMPQNYSLFYKGFNTHVLHS